MIKHELITFQYRINQRDKAKQAKEDRKRLEMQRIKFFIKDGNDTQTGRREPDSARKHMATLLDALEKAINAQKDT
jgi:hypothetical protein